MDAITTIFVAAIKIIVDSGVLSRVSDGATTKIGENITDGVGNISQRLWAMLKRKSPNTDTVKKLGKGQEIDYQQAVIDVEAIADDPDVVKLLDEVRSLLESNQELAARVEELAAQAIIAPKIVQVMASDIEGVNLRAKSMKQTAPSGSSSVEQTMLKNVKVTDDIDLGDLTQEA
ncbi:hypothetical protein PseudUWO311_17440 [Pseudanabaena sp. UWO311]|uniref:hypothetical protein n=1 Tax=Pseudanabaena sp. UWO311 TaxID=2487337 RepID=UPI001159BF52|nr:hypothetical protein [Pseudanabaena sp. UWO311]TYQ24804.1 hypothetical protein PseudUWO311_17440 [Pseudanabaena sp. UWO311]